MDINTNIGGQMATIYMNGRFDFNVHRSFKEAYDELLAQPGITNLEVNLAQVDYLDSSALGMLLLRERAQLAGKTVVLRQPNSVVTQILDIANFGKLFTIQ